MSGHSRRNGLIWDNEGKRCVLQVDLKRLTNMVRLGKSPDFGAEHMACQGLRALYPFEVMLVYDRIEFVRTFTQTRIHHVSSFTIDLVNPPLGAKGGWQVTQ